MPKRFIPSVEGYAAPDESGMLFAPAAARNAAAITALLKQVTPSSGSALEIASGTGQHIIELAQNLPGLHWHPTEIDAKRRASIDARVDAAGLINLSHATVLDATTPGWSADHAGHDLILLVNLLHLISEDEARVLIREAAAALGKGGHFVVYGPFKRSGVLTSPGDIEFHETLQAQDRAAGYKDDVHIIAWLKAQGFARVESVEMPANNLAIIAHKA